MTKDKLWVLLGVAILGVALWMTVWDESKSKSQWSTEFGPLELILHYDGRVEGRYPEYEGRVIGRYDPVSGSMSGIWEQKTAQRLCANADGDTKAWGRFTWQLEDRDRFIGVWSYCDAEPTSDLTWDGTFEGGIHPRDAEITPPPVLDSQ